MTASSPKLRTATVEEAEALAQLKLDTFRETFLVGFGIPYPPEDLAQFEAEMYSSARVRSELTDPAHHTWVIEDDGRLVAYAHVGPCKLPHPDAKDGDMELYQIYICGAVQGMGLGRRLMDVALNPTPNGLPAAQWLGVWSGNAKAQRFYETFGFAKAGEYKFKVGDWFDEEYIYRRT